MTDNHYFDKNTLVQENNVVLKSKEFVYIQDNLNGSQPQQIRFVCDGFRSSSKANNISEGFIALPLVLAISAQPTVPNAAVVDFKQSTNPEMMVVLKNYVNLIESISVEIDGKSVVQITPKVNIFNNFKLHQYTDYNEYINNTAFKGYVKDDNNFLFVPFNKTTLTGNGIINNNYALNRALTSHNENENINISNSLLSKKNWNAIFNSSNVDSMKNYTTVETNKMTTYLMAYIPLTDLSDFFKNMVAVRGLNMNILLNMNTNTIVNLICQTDANKIINMQIGSNVYVDNKTSSNLSMYSTNIVSPNGTVPFMITQPSSNAIINDYSKGWNLKSGTYDAQGAFTASLAISKITIGLYYGMVKPSSFDQTNLFLTAHPIKIARLYAPMLEIQPYLDDAYFKANENKTILFDDVIALPKYNLAGAFNEVLSPSVLNIKGLLSVPYWAAIHQGGKSELENPFSSAPNTGSIFDIQDFNVVVASKNIYQEDSHYSFQTFLYELNKNFDKIEGDGGLFSFEDFNNLYHYYYVNLERHVPETEVYGKSIGVRGILKANYNALYFNPLGSDAGSPSNNVPIDLYNFIIVQKKLTINADTGKIIELI